ncbi:uncharacterized protein LOC143241657 isoform X2 [Tachypleus tridentatus]|uniref:uncharacterized protein LOC143241657 isoform X2 n=1 Tax=Tachypleus tridentatus TaxID=6853 RepID=UPI003FD67002
MCEGFQLGNLRMLNEKSLLSTGIVPRIKKEVSEDGMVPPGQYKYPVAIELTLSGPFATSRSPPSSQTHCMGIQLIERTLYRSLAIKYSSTHNHTAVAFDPIENFNQKNILIYNLLLKNTVVLTKFIGQFLFHKPL